MSCHALIHAQHVGKVLTVQLKTVWLRKAVRVLLGSQPKTAPPWYGLAVLLTQPLR